MDDRIRTLSALGASYRTLAEVLPLDPDQLESEEEMGRQEAAAAAVATLEQAAGLISPANATYAIEVYNNLGNALEAQFDGADYMVLKRAIAAYGNGIGWTLKNEKWNPAKIPLVMMLLMRWRQTYGQTSVQFTRN